MHLGFFFVVVVSVVAFLREDIFKFNEIQFITFKNMGNFF